MIIARDPDIPDSFQRVYFKSSLSETSQKHSLKWILNNTEIGTLEDSVSWEPKRGNYQLSLLDSQGAVVDSVKFVVR